MSYQHADAASQISRQLFRQCIKLIDLTLGIVAICLASHFEEDLERQKGIGSPEG